MIHQSGSIIGLFSLNSLPPRRLRQLWVDCRAGIRVDKGEQGVGVPFLVIKPPIKFMSPEFPPHNSDPGPNTCNILEQYEDKMYQFLHTILSSNQHRIPSFNCHLARNQELAQRNKDLETWHWHISLGAHRVGLSGLIGNQRRVETQLVELSQNLDLLGFRQDKIWISWELAV